ncbi:hypothetical protein B0H34DRAFT_840346 [Crassisporium funariophilum]|nr:hypothetical protein B0H34DRAFT_840346 [Crassisporium funariophilum]
MAVRLSSRINPGDIQNLFDAGQKLEPTAVGTQVLIMTILSLLTIITFNLARPGNKVIYEPKLKYHAGDNAPPHISDSFCGWLPPLIHTKQPELVRKIGLDAVAFLRFLHLLRWLFTLTALIGCGILIPLDLLYTLSAKPPEFNILSAMTIRDVQGPRLYAHIGVTYLITFVLLVLVHHHWRAIYTLRNQWFRSSEYQRSFHARTLCITHIPHRRQSDTGLYNLMTGMQLPYTVTSVHIAKSAGALPQLIEQHNKTVKEFEKVLVKYLNSNSAGKRRPMVRVGGCCGLGGTRMDAVKYYTLKLKRTEATVQQYRAQLDIHQAENYGFASLDSISSAHSAARELRGKHPKGTTIKLAPNPKDIIWENIGRSESSVKFRRCSGFILLHFFCVLSLVPLFPVASLANLDAVSTGYIPFLQTWSARSPTTYSVVSGTLPPAIAAIFSYFLPRLMRWLSKYMGATTQTSLDRVVIARYFAFLVASQLLVFTLIGIIFNSVLEIISAVKTQNASLKIILENLDKLPASITRTYVDQSSFWLKWFPMRGFLVLFDLAQIFNLLWVSFKSRMHRRTPRDIREWTKPPAFEYAIQYSNLLFMAAVGLLFAPLAPLVALVAAIVFWLSSWVYKYQLLFVFVTNVETGGRLWNVVINRLLVSAMFMQVLMILTIGFQIHFKSVQCLAAIPPFLATLLFKIYLKRRFTQDFQYFLPRYEELSRAIVHSEDPDTAGNKLETRYRHPMLNVEVYTPMVHAQDMPLLRRIYKRKNGQHEDLTRGIGTDHRKGKIMEKNGKDEDVMEGIEFNPISESQLEYDPALYKRDRGEVECDFDSVTSSSPSSVTGEALSPPRPTLDYTRDRSGTMPHRGSGHELSDRVDPPPTPRSLLAERLEALQVRQARGRSVHERRPSLLADPPSYVASEARGRGHRVSHDGKNMRRNEHDNTRGAFGYHSNRQDAPSGRAHQAVNSGRQNQHPSRNQAVLDLSAVHDPPRHRSEDNQRGPRKSAQHAHQDHA